MPTARLPDNCDLGALLDAMHRAGVADPCADGPPAAVVHVAGFVETAAIAWLAAWGIAWRAGGRRLKLIGEADPLRYLGRMDLHRHLGIDPPPMKRRIDAGRLLPVSPVPDADAGYTALHALCDVIAHQFDDAAAFIPAVDWAVAEVLDNIDLHADAPHGGVVVAQHFPKVHRLSLAVADVGRGIRASLGPSHGITSHADAVRMALQRGITRDPQVGQGNGLAGTHTIAEHNRGRLRLWSGDAIYDSAGAYRSTPAAPGTVLALDLDTRRPVDLTATWLGDRGSMYLEGEAERLEGDAVAVKAEVLGTGTRVHARPLRRKLEAVLTEMDEPLVLDFAGITRATSSFLDELLGRLAAHLGADAFARRVRVVGMTPLVAGLAETVTRQRLWGLDAG